jgi:uncharacterized protein YraI
MRNLMIAPAVAATALLAFSSAGWAQLMATANVDLNVRSGPGPQYEVIGVIAANSGATIQGCIEGSQWCQVSFDGGQGWAYSAYLTSQQAGSAVIVPENRAEIGVPTVTFEGGDGAVTGAAGGAITGALIGGPVGAVIGGVTGLAIGASLDDPPPPQVQTYVTSNLGDPVYLEGEVVVGAQLPQTVELRTIPNYEYSYVYVNGVPVLVEPTERRIVYIMR